MKKESPLQTSSLACIACLLLMLTGCAEHAPVPGGTDNVNSSFYKTKGDFLSRLPDVAPGMSQEEALAKLGRKEGELVRLKRDEILTALLGTDNITLKDENIRQELLQTLYGYKLIYKKVERKHGFTSPIRVRTDEKGFDYTVILIFRDGSLFASPIVTGGVVNASSSKTFFDFLSPGIAVDRAVGR